MSPDKRLSMLVSIIAGESLGKIAVDGCANPVVVVRDASVSIGKAESTWNAPVDDTDNATFESQR